MDLVTLKDGTQGWVWPLLPTDKRALSAEFESLSPESRRSRFLRTVEHLSPAMLRQLVDDVDGVDHIALVCLAERGDELVPAGIARIVRYPDHPDTADVAVTVKDEWQGHGVASAMLPLLAARRPQGVVRVVTEVSADNPASLAMLRRLGPVTTTNVSEGILEVVVDLAPRVEELPAEERRRLRASPWRPQFGNRDLVCAWLAGQTRNDI